MENLGKACEPQKESPIERAKNRLRNLIGETKEVMTGFETRFFSVVGQPEESLTDGEKAETAPQTQLEEYLVAMAKEVAEINNYLVSVQNRIQL